ncbi:MAG: hypothetical protein GEV28_16765 [Actinophytocola sp.]|uniref:protease inhibitor I42 family protein n=1 Tax=Actinophytocola sp. TaxID=1872138 RepID=UPI001321231C|nr:protease inhibitor I42 family protein [Actinophytocola sp.]MPZ81948.1 hypothetical protein [Actinophytocola sp.]
MRRVTGCAAVAALILLGSACAAERPGTASPGTTVPEATEPEHGTEFSVEDTHIEVARGESFTIAVTDNASVGDKWTLSEEPDAAVVTTNGDDYVPDSADNREGDGGTRYFLFDATAAGTTSLALFNCFQGCHQPKDERRYPIQIEVG